MPLAPIEILTLAFPGNRFTGRILPELAKVVENDTITIIDGLFVSVDEMGEVTYTEFDELGQNSDASALTELIERFDELLESRPDASSATSSSEISSSKRSMSSVSAASSLPGRSSSNSV